MRKGIRVVFLFLLGLLSTAVLGAATAVMAAVSLAASTALIVPGTGTPDASEVEFYMPNFRDYYMQETTCTEAADCELDGVPYFASFWPIPLPGWCDPGRCEKFDVSVDDGVQNLKAALEALQALDPAYDGDLVIAGYSQGARVVSIAKTKIANGEWPGLIDQLDSVEFVFIGNPNRPNGGILSRFGILGHIPILDVTTGQPTPTDTVFPTEDWAIRWEGIADFPQYLFNPLAVLNSIMGFTYDHGTYLAVNEGSDPGELPAGYDVDLWREITSNPEEYPGVVEIQKIPGSDTTYYTVTPKVLPVVRPLHSIPFIGKPIADLIEPALRVIIEETGYNRDIPFGQYSPIGLFPIFNPIELAIKLIPAIFQGINNFLANFGLATEIPLTDTTRVPLPTTSSQEDEPDLAKLVGNEVDESSSGATPAVVQGDDDVKQKLDEDGEETLVAVTQTDGELTLSVGNVTPVIKDEVIADEVVADEVVEAPVAKDEVIADEVVESTTQQETVPDPSATVNSEDVNEKDVNEKDVNEKGTAPVDGDTVVAGKKPEASSNPAQNRLDANNRSASLNFSPNKPAKSPTSSAEGASKPELTAKPEPADDPMSPASPASPENADDSKDSEPAAAAA